MADVLKVFGVGGPETALEIADAFRAMLGGFLQPFPGAIDALDGLRASGVQLALLTNGGAEWQRSKIQQFELARHFDCILIEGECGFGKPDERIYRLALDALSAEPIATWMVGDNLEWDIAGAQRLGIHGVWVDPRGKGLPPTATVRPDRIIACIAELLSEQG
jgi:putative hydrolase of the HAD superfamily